MCLEKAWKTEKSRICFYFWRRFKYFFKRSLQLLVLFRGRRSEQLLMQVKLLLECSQAEYNFINKNLSSLRFIMSKIVQSFCFLNASLQIYRVMALYNISDSDTTEQFFSEVLIKESSLYKEWMKNVKLKCKKKQYKYLASDTSSTFF